MPAAGLLNSIVMQWQQQHHSKWAQCRPDSVELHAVASAV